MVATLPTQTKPAETGLPSFYAAVVYGPGGGTLGLVRGQGIGPLQTLLAIEDHAANKIAQSCGQVEPGRFDGMPFVMLVAEGADLPVRRLVARGVSDFQIRCALLQLRLHAEGFLRTLATPTMAPPKNDRQGPTLWKPAD